MANKAQRRTLLNRLSGAVDAFVSTISPEAGMRRALARSMLEATARQREQLNASAYEGAESDRLRANKWLGSRLSEQSAIEGDRGTQTDRSRELYRTSSFGGVVDGNAKNVVGTGGLIQSRVKAVDGIVSQNEADAINTKLDWLWEVWAKRVDVSRLRSFRQSLRLANKHIDVDGRSLTIMSDVGSSYSPLPLCLEVIDPKRLQTPPGKINDKNCRMGIEKDSIGRIVAYWLRKELPDDNVDVGYSWERVNASRVIHVFDPVLAETSDGVPKFSRVMNDTKDSKDASEAAIIALQIQLCHALFVKSKRGGSAARAVAMGNGTAEGPRRQQDIQPGTISFLDGDDEIVSTSPTSPGGNFPAFMEHNNRRIAAGLDYPYELLTKDWSGVSFAGGRIILSDARLTWADRRKLLDEMKICVVWQRFVEEAVILGEVDIDPRLYAQAPWAFWGYQWIPPAWPYVLNPGEEVDAAKTAVDENFRTRTDVAAELFGTNIEDVYEAREWEVGQEEDRGITPPTTPGSVKPNTPAMEPANA